MQVVNLGLPATPFGQTLLVLAMTCTHFGCQRKLASPFGHPTQVSTPVQLVLTCIYLLSFWPGLNYCGFQLIKIDFGWEQSWRSGDSAHLPPVWPRFDSWTLHHMWVEFVVGSLLCSERVFSRDSGFPLSSKTNVFKCLFDLGMDRHFCTSSCELLGTPWVNKLHLFYI